jgi:aminoglycoside/choline kinase family phosphotransferase
MTDTDVRARIDQFLKETGLTDQGAKVVPLTGDASDRRYVRVLLRNAPSQVLAVHPQAIDFDRLPFANVARLYSAMPVPVPQILSHSNALGIIALQDLGDVTLQAHLGAASPAEHAALYRQAVTLIETLQRRGAELASAEFIPYGIAFDEDKLTWELQFFTKHFLEGYRGAALTGAARDALAVEYAAIVKELAAEPRVLCHRDYHSRNLMLRDSYVDFTEPQVDELIAFFQALRGAHTASSNAAAERVEFRRRFDLMALQRNLKALGTFGFQTISRGNTVYIQYIPRTLNYVRGNLERDARFGRLRGLLGEHLEELR